LLISGSSKETVIDLYNLEVYAQGSQNGTMNNISKAAPMANMSTVILKTW